MPLFFGGLGLGIGIARLFGDFWRRTTVFGGLLDFWRRTKTFAYQTIDGPQNLLAKRQTSGDVPAFVATRKNCRRHGNVGVTRRLVVTRENVWRPATTCGDLPRLVPTRQDLWRPAKTCQMDGQRAESLGVAPNRLAWRRTIFGRAGISGAKRNCWATRRNVGRRAKTLGNALKRWATRQFKPFGDVPHRLATRQIYGAEPNRLATRQNIWRHTEVMAPNQTVWWRAEPFGDAPNFWRRTELCGDPLNFFR